MCRLTFRPTTLTVNLPVKDLATSSRFFAELGFWFDKRIANENMNALVINDDAYVLLVAEPYFKTITKKANKTIADATQHRGDRAAGSRQ